MQLKPKPLFRAGTIVQVAFYAGIPESEGIILRRMRLHGQLAAQVLHRSGMVCAVLADLDVLAQTDVRGYTACRTALDAYQATVTTYRWCMPHRLHTLSELEHLRNTVRDAYRRGKQYLFCYY